MEDRLQEMDSVRHHVEEKKELSPLATESRETQKTVISKTEVRKTFKETLYFFIAGFFFSTRTEGS